MTKQKQNKKKLTAKQERFCQEYVILLNATQAAKNAGYSDKTSYAQGHRLLKYAEIKARIAELTEEKMQELGLSHYYVLKNLKDISDMAMQQKPIRRYDEDEAEWYDTGLKEPENPFAALNALESISKHLILLNPEKDPKHASQIDKLKAETELIKVKTQALKGLEKDTSMLEALIKGQEQYDDGD